MKCIPPKLFFLLGSLVLIGLPLWGQQSLSYKQEIQEYRVAKQAIFLQKSNSSPSTILVEGVKYFPPRIRFRLMARLERVVDAPVMQMATYDGQKHLYKKYGVLHFKWKGQALQLAVYKPFGRFQALMDREVLFLPFKDQTNDQSTYGGGRYINLRMSEIKDGQIPLDFNKAYNPYCAYGDGWSCPIPPSENHLAIKIKAGEKKYEP